MLRHSTPSRQLMSGINKGRQRLASQFATMDGWQAKQDARFDAFVRERRTKEYHDGFDQRVERAYRAAAAAHKTEVLNSFKRRLKEGSARYTAETALELQRAVEDRLAWLRDVWTQIDADYRSPSDPARQERAAREISAALRGEPGAYMQWVYEQKRERRFLGPKGTEAWEAELADAELPEVSDEEANRYHALRPSMAAIEAQVKTRYGLAGQQHWAELQAAKDAQYEAKLDRAAEVYKALLDQDASREESQRTQLLRANVARTHEAQVRFRAAMALEDEREKLIEAHRAMQEARKLEAKEARRQLLREAAELKAKGATSEEIRVRMQQRQLDLAAQRQAERSAREREEITAKKEKYLTMLEQLRDQFERRDGEELLTQRQPSPAREGEASRPLNSFGFMDDDRIDEAGTAGPLASSSSSDDRSVAQQQQQQQQVQQQQQQQPSPSSKKALWAEIDADTYESPFLTVHQARMDANQTYDPLYSTFNITKLAQGRKYSRQNTGEMAAGGGMEGDVYKGALYKNIKAYNWGLQPGQVHDLDSDGGVDYVTNRTWHVRDKETGDIDWRYEKKKGGPVFRGPRFYRIGAEKEEQDLGSRSIDPTPVTEGLLQKRALQQQQQQQQRLSSGNNNNNNSNDSSSSNGAGSPPLRRKILNWKDMD